MPGARRIARAAAAAALSAVPTFSCSSSIGPWTGPSSEPASIASMRARCSVRTSEAVVTGSTSSANVERGKTPSTGLKRLESSAVAVETTGGRASWVISSSASAAVVTAPRLSPTNGILAAADHRNPSVRVRAFSVFSCRAPRMRSACSVSPELISSCSTLAWSVASERAPRAWLASQPIHPASASSTTATPASVSHRGLRLPLRWWRSRAVRGLRASRRGLETAPADRDDRGDEVARRRPEVRSLREAMDVLGAAEVRRSGRYRPGAYVR